MHLEKNPVAFHNTIHTPAIQPSHTFLGTTPEEYWPEDIHNMLLIAAPNQNNTTTHQHVTDKPVHAHRGIPDTAMNVIGATTWLITGGCPERN